MDLDAVADRLATDEVVWLTTVDGSGQPQSSPVWFHWDGSTFFIRTEPGAAKVANIGTRPLVALHLDGVTPGKRVVSIEGAVLIGEHTSDGYATKYAAAIARIGSTVEDYQLRFSVSLVITPTRVRMFTSD